MTFYILGYFFISLCTTIATINLNNSNTTNELIASIIVGILWPILFITRIIHKILY